jgi:hypothetical protein
MEACNQTGQHRLHRVVAVGGIAAGKVVDQAEKWVKENAGK